MTLVAGSVKMYTELLHVDHVKTEITRTVAKGLGIISRRHEFRKIVVDAGTEQTIINHMMKDPTVYISKKGAQVVEDIVLGETNPTAPERRIRVAQVLEFYMYCFTDCFEIENQENSIRAIASFAFSQEIRTILTESRRIEKLLEHAMSSASPLILECVAKVIYRVCCTEWDEVGKETVLAMTLKRYTGLLGDKKKSGIREAATLGLVILSSMEVSRKLIMEDAKIIDILLGLLEEHEAHQAWKLVVYLLQNIVAKGSGLEELERISIMERVVTTLAAFRTEGIPFTVQGSAIEALVRFAFRHEIGECSIVYPGAVHQLSSCLRKVEFQDMLRRVRKKAEFEAMLTEVCGVVEFASAARTDVGDLHEEMSGLQSSALQFCMSIMEDGTLTFQKTEGAHFLARLLCYETNRELFKSVCPTGQACLRRIVDRRYGGVVRCAAIALTLLNPEEAESGMSLSSVEALHGGGWGRIFWKDYSRALELLDRAVKMDPRESGLFCRRAFVKVQLGNTAGALEDLNHGKIHCDFILQERGILKSIMEDWEGALLDLNECVRILLPDNYEVLKHRGYTRFRLGDEDGARFDAQQALSLKFHACGLDVVNPCLGTSTVKYLEFEL